MQTILRVLGNEQQVAFLLVHSVDTQQRDTTLHLHNTKHLECCKLACCCRCIVLVHPVSSETRSNELLIYLVSYLWGSEIFWHKEMGQQYILIPL